MTEVLAANFEEICLAVYKLNSLHIKGLGEGLTDKEISIINEYTDLIKPIGKGDYGETYCVFPH